MALVDRLYNEDIRDKHDNMIKVIDYAEDYIEIGDIITFNNFDRTLSGRVVGIICYEKGTTMQKVLCEEMFIVWARNPYGSHNLVVVDKNLNAIRHGNEISLGFASLHPRIFKKVVKFLHRRGRKVRF